MKNYKKFIITFLILLFLCNISLFSAKLKEQPIKGEALTTFRGAAIDFQRNDFDVALPKFLKVINLKPDHVLSIYRIANIYFEKAGELPDDEAIELYETSKEYFEKVIQTIGTIKENYLDFDTYENDSKNKIEGIFVRIFNIGKDNFDMEDYDTSEEIYLFLSELFPDRGEPYQMLAAIALRNNDTEKSLEYFQKIFEVDPNNTKILLNIANQFEQDEQWDKAIEYNLKYLEIFPEDMNCLSSIAYLYNKLENYSDALIYYEKALEIEPNNAINLNNALIMTKLLQDKEKSLFYYKKLIEIDSNVDVIIDFCYFLANFKEWETLVTYSIMWYENNEEDPTALDFIIISAMQSKNNDVREKYQAIKDSLK
jgi:tetratricopeptide (TPR) repeat protein